MWKKQYKLTCLPFLPFPSFLLTDTRLLLCVVQKSFLVFTFHCHFVKAY